MGWRLRYRGVEGESWREHHKLVQVTQAPGEEPTAAENAWVLEQRVVKVDGERCRVAWNRQDDIGAPQELSSGELWVDQLGSASPDGKTWSPGIFPEQELDVGDVWTQQNSAVGIPIHFKLEQADENTVSLVSYAQVTAESSSQETRASSVLCTRTGRVLKSTTVTTVEQPDGTTIKTVAEVETEGL